MNWYSIKKYIPLTGREYLVRCENNDSYERIFVASIEFNEDVDYFQNWDLSNSCHTDLDKRDYKVSHFCDIDPTEIEKDE